MQLNFKSYGQGPPLLILHGFLGSSDNWHTLASQLGNHFQVFTIDLRNHGRSPHTPTHYLNDMVLDVIEWMDQQALLSTSILGHSMGGKVAMRLALDHPERIEKLMIADIGPQAYPRGHDDVFAALAAVDLNAVKSRKDAEDQMLEHLPDFGVRQFVLKNLERLADNTYQWRMNLPVLQHDYESMIAALLAGQTFTKPVLFLKGEHSTYIREQDLEGIAAFFPNYRLIVISNAGHWVHADNPPAVFEAVRAFMLES